MKKKGTMCEACGKHAYANQTIAYRWALICSKRAGRPLRVYPCPLGHGFHLTKQVRRVVAA